MREAQVEARDGIAVQSAAEPKTPPWRAPQRSLARLPSNAPSRARLCWDGGECDFSAVEAAIRVASGD